MAVCGTRNPADALGDSWIRGGYTAQTTHLKAHPPHRIEVYFYVEGRSSDSCFNTDYW